MESGGRIFEVAPGIVRATLPVPSEMDGLHVYLLVESDGIIMVDCGPRKAGTLEILEAALRQIGASWDRLQGLVLTPWHMDHSGNAAEVRGRSRCWVAIHERDAAESAQYHRDPEGMLGGNPSFLSLVVSEQMARTVAETPSAFSRWAGTSSWTVRFGMRSSCTWATGPPAWFDPRPHPQIPMSS